MGLTEGEGTARACIACTAQDGLRDAESSENLGIAAINGVYVLGLSPALWIEYVNFPIVRHDNAG